MKVTTWPSDALDLLEHGLEPLLELTAVLRAGDHRAEVEGDEPLAAQRLGHVAVDDALGEPLDDGGLADTGLADQHGVVLGAAREHLHDAADLVVAADHRVEPALAGGLGEVGAVLRERLAGGLRVLGGDLGAAAQVVDLGLEGGRVSLDGSLLEQGEEQHVGRQVGVTAGCHQRGGLLEHGERRLAERRGGDGGARTARHPGQHRAGRGSHALGRAARGGEQGGRRGALLLGERQGQVGGGDLGVAGGLRRALGDGQGLGHLRGGLQLHAGLSSNEVVGSGSSRATGPKLSLFRSTPAMAGV